MAFPLVVAGLTWAGVQVPPDLIVHKDGDLAAVRLSNGAYAFSTLSSAKFERDVWLRRAGLNTPPERWSDAKGAVRCDALGCVYRKEDKAVAFVRHPEALEEDCAKAALVFNLSGSAHCRGSPSQESISQADLVEIGTVSVWFDETGAVHRQSVMETRGQRPWVLRAQGNSSR